jgi:hypothetical protein
MVGLLCACSEPTPASPDTSAPPTPIVTSTTSSPAVNEDESRPVEMLKHQFTSAIKDKNPADRLTSAQAGKRVYFHMTVRNRTGRDRKLHVTFLVNGEKRSEVDLTVAESWSYRTWAYNTLQSKDTKGKLEVQITDDEGNPIVDETLPLSAP